MFEYKQRWDAEIERCRERGLHLPDPIPHPDDIMLDRNSGDARIDGPMTKEQRAFYEKARSRRMEAQEE